MIKTVDNNTGRGYNKYKYYINVGRMSKYMSLSIGIALGIVFGIIFDNLAMGIAIGVALGVAIKGSKDKRK